MATNQIYNFVIQYISVHGSERKLYIYLKDSLAHLEFIGFYTMTSVFCVCSLKWVWMKQVYLEKFYNYKPVTGRRRRAAQPDSFKAKLREMQHFFGLEESGDVDPHTVAAMRRARCGLSDVEPFRKTMRWTNRTLTYRWGSHSLLSWAESTALWLTFSWLCSESPDSAQSWQLHRSGQHSDRHGNFGLKQCPWNSADREGVMLTSSFPSITKVWEEKLTFEIMELSNSLTLLCVRVYFQGVNRNL